jgi:hypothetical protein
MRRFTPEQAAAALEIEQFVSAYWHEIDVNGGRNIDDFWFDDGHFTAGTVVDIKGLDGIRKFYADRVELIEKESGGARTSRHTSTNTRCAFEGADRVSLDMTVLNYSGAGSPPIAGAAPTMVADARMELRRDRAGEWRLMAFHGRSIFVGGDPFQNKRLMGSADPVKA